MNISCDDFAIIDSVDLDPIKVKLMHRESGEGWSLERANAVEFEYRRFLYLMKKYPNEQAAPNFDVDIFWHYHILDTVKYAQDCQAMFGYFLHHFPYLGLRGEDDLVAHQRVGERMGELYEETFGEPYPSLLAEDGDTSPSKKTAFSVRIGAGTAFSVATGHGAAVPTNAAPSVATSATAFSVRVVAQSTSQAKGTAFSVASTATVLQPKLNSANTPAANGDLEVSDFFSIRPRIPMQAAG